MWIISIAHLIEGFYQGFVVLGSCKVSISHIEMQEKNTIKKPTTCYHINHHNAYKNGHPMKISRGVPLNVPLAGCQYLSNKNWERYFKSLRYLQMLQHISVCIWEWSDKKPVSPDCHAQVG